MDASPDGSAAQGLADLARAGEGRAVAASGAKASEVFTEIAQTYPTQLSFAAPLPADAAGRDVQLKVTVEGAAGPIFAEQVVSVPATAPVAAAPVIDGTTARPFSFWVMLAAVGLGSFLLLAVAVITGDSRAGDIRRTKEVLGTYSFGPRVVPGSPEGNPVGDSQLAQSALHLADRAVQARGSGARLAIALDRAGVAWRPHEWLVLWTVSTVLGAALAALTLGGALMLLLGAVIGNMAPRLWLKVRARQRQRAFLEALPDALQLIAASLSSGYSLAQALDARRRKGVSRWRGSWGGRSPSLASAWPLEDALDSVADRMACEDFRWIVMAVRVQRQVGGNLAEVL